MNEYLKSKVIQFLSIFNVYPSPLTDRKALRELIRNLAPVSTDGGLIRLGPSGDGGYLVPNDLEGIEACFSPGVSNVSGFEEDCAQRGMKVFMADRSVDRAAAEHELFSFTKKFIGSTSNEDFLTIDDWVSTALPTGESDLMLQMDIENYEYETFLNMSDELLCRFRIIVTEFHSLNHLWDKQFFSLASKAFERILQTHSCVHIHPNNGRKLRKLKGVTIPPTAEFTFLRNDRIRNPIYANEFPHPLDSDCTDAKHISLPKCWYRF